MMVLLAFAALLLPGLTWWAWLGKRDQDPMLSLAQVIGVSLASLILLAEAVFFLGGRFSTAGILIFLIACGAVAAWGFAKKGLKIPRSYRRQAWIGLVLFGLVIALRLYQARDLLLPSWVDSQHHYLIIRVILEQRGLPQTLEPYLSTPFYYHFGFHAITALFTFLSRLEIGVAMLLLGQVLSACISLSVYALGKTLWKDWHPALAASLLVGFVTRMPAYYLSWGRYTLTIGLVLLPLAVAWALNLLSEDRRKSDILMLSLITAAVLLSHYFAAILLAIFFILLVLVKLISKLRHIRTGFRQTTWLLVGILVGLFLAAPWLTRVLAFSSASAGINSNLPESVGDVFNDTGKLDYITNLLGPTSNHWLLIVAGAGLLVGLIRRNAIPFLLWSLVLGALTLPFSLELGPFRPDHFAIVLFLPVALLAGWLFWQVGWILDKLFKQRWIQTVLLVVIVVGWSAWAFPLTTQIVNPVTVLVDEADLQALEWINLNTPHEARFFINTSHWLNNIYRGVDAGGWLLPYTGRWAVVPTVFYSFSPDKGLTQQIRDWGERASTITTCSPEFWLLVEEADLDWAYIREGEGSLQPKGLEGCVGVNLAYSQDGVFIYHIPPD